MPFVISEEEWEFVNTFFSKTSNHQVCKLPHSHKKKPISYFSNGKAITLTHSYYRDDNNIFAVGNKKDIFSGKILSGQPVNRIIGGQGAVKRAENAKGEPYILKIYDLEKMSLRAKCQMTQEQQLGKKIRIHPTNTKPLIHSVISRKDKNKKVVVMEFLGIDLLCWKRSFQPTDQKILDVAIQMITLVNALHEGKLSLDGVRLIHRDLKPENFTIEKDGTVYLIDYGMTIEAGKGLIGEVWSNEIINYYGRYTPPEASIWRGIDYSFKSDTYSLGTIFLNLFPKKSLKSMHKVLELIELMVEENPLDRPHLRWMNIAFIFERYKDDSLGCKAALAKINLSITAAEMLMRKDIDSLLREKIARLLSVVNDVSKLDVVERAIEKLLPDSKNTIIDVYKAEALQCLLLKSMPHDLLTIENITKIIDGSTNYAKSLAASYRFLVSHDQIDEQDWIAGHGVRSTHYYVRNILRMDVAEHTKETERYLNGKGPYSLARFFGSSSNNKTSRKTLFNIVRSSDDTGKNLEDSDIIGEHKYIPQHIKSSPSNKSTINAVEVPADMRKSDKLSSEVTSDLLMQNIEAKELTLVLRQKSTTRDIYNQLPTRQRDLVKQEDTYKTVATLFDKLAQKQESSLSNNKYLLFREDLPRKIILEYLFDEQQLALTSSQPRKS